METTTDKRLFNVQEAATYLGLSVAGVYRRVEGRQIAPVRNGRRRLLDRADMDAWIAKNRVKPL